MMMTTEIIFLISSLLLGFVQLSLATLSATLVRGPRWNLSSRDQVAEPLTGKAARIDRAFQNFKETFPFFITAVLIVILSERTGAISAFSAGAYVVARSVYLPLYIFNVIFARSLVWCISMFAILGVLAQLFFS